jgi:PAS domain S-box-containing protein
MGYFISYEKGPHSLTTVDSVKKTIHSIQDLKSMDFPNGNALHEAVAQDNFEVVTYLVENIFSSDLLGKNEAGCTPLDIAIQRGNPDIIHYLCDKVNMFHLGEMLENLNDAVVVSDASALILGFNQTSEHLFGYSKCEIIGRNIKVLIYDKAVIDKHDYYVAQFVETGVKHLVGTQRVVAAKGKLGQKIFVDISLAALNSGKYLATFRRVNGDNRKELISGIKDAVIMTQHNGRISAVNQPAELLFGYTEDELIDELPSILMWDENLKSAHSKFMHNYFTSGIQRFIGVRRAVNVKRKDGTRLQVEILLSELSDKSFLATFRQVRPREQVEKELLWSMELNSREETSTETVDSTESESGSHYVLQTHIMQFAIPTCIAGDIEGLKTLIVKHHLDINTKDYNGDTLLHHSAKAGIITVVKYLLQQSGITPLVPNKEHKTAVELAKENGHEYIVSYMKTIQEEYQYKYVTPVLKQNSNQDIELPLLEPKSRVCKMNVSMRELIYEEELGRGSFGVVYKGKWRYVTVAIKNLKIASKDSLEDLQQEALLLLELRPHPNVYGILGVCWEKDHYAIITEYLAGGSLDKFLQKNQYSEKELIEILLDVAMGVAHLHTENILHRDIAARNVLLTGEIPRRAKIGDFGFAKILEKFSNNYVEAFGGAVRWMPPEALKYNTFSIHSDTWSFGILCYECFSKSPPYSGWSLHALVKEIGSNYLTPMFSAETPPFVQDLAKACWAREPTERPTFHDIVEKISSYLKSL